MYTNYSNYKPEIIIHPLSKHIINPSPHILIMYMCVMTLTLDYYF